MKYYNTEFFRSSTKLHSTRWNPKKKKYPTKTTTKLVVFKNNSTKVQMLCPRLMNGVGHGRNLVVVEVEESHVQAILTVGRLHATRPVELRARLMTGPNSK